MTLTYDLHSHSTASDGLLSPADLTLRAAAKGVTHLALTDHDTLAGQYQAEQTAKAAGINLINGIELSADWQGRCIHIVGLGVATDNPQLTEGCRSVAEQRDERARRMAAKIAKLGFDNVYAEVSEQAGSAMITRSHFARFLLNKGRITSLQQAFDRYLGEGKPCYVSGQWPELAQAVAWIRAAGGVAVLAHPLRYNLTKTVSRKLLAEFVDEGGQALEVVTGQNNPNHVQTSADWARQFGLAASVGSDFHDPGTGYLELGKLLPLPSDLQPVWHLLH